MKTDLKITYTYQHKTTGDRQRRTFLLSEIKRGEDDAHLAIIPDYELIGVDCPLCEDFAIAAAAMKGGLDMRGDPAIPNANFFATRHIQMAVDLSAKALEIWEQQNR